MAKQFSYSQKPRLNFNCLHLRNPCTPTLDASESSQRSVMAQMYVASWRIHTAICAAIIIWLYLEKVPEKHLLYWPHQSLWLRESESESRSVLSDSLRPQGLHSPWNSLGPNTGVGSLSLLQCIFPTQGSNPGLLHYRWILYQLSHKGSQQTVENSSRDGNMRIPDLPPETSVCRSRSSSWTGHGTTDWFQIRKGYVKAVYCHIAYLIYMWNARLDEEQAGIKTAGRNINNLRYADDTTHRKQRRTKEPFDESEKGEWKSCLKTQHSEN